MNNPLESPSAAPHRPLLARRARTGKVARLPKTLRDQINLLLQDGIPYARIIERLGLEASHINEDTRHKAVPETEETLKTADHGLNPLTHNHTQPNLSEPCRA